jgi:hypothetical protein
MPYMCFSGPDRLRVLCSDVLRQERGMTPRRWCRNPISAKRAAILLRISLVRQMYILCYTLASLLIYAAYVVKMYAWASVQIQRW